MATYIVNYDLNKHGQNYNCIVKKLESYSTYWHMQGSGWILITNDSAKQIRNNLKPCLDSNDELFVAKLSGEAAWAGYNSDITEWLKLALTNQYKKVA